MSINVKIAKAHSSQLQDEDTKREIESISYAINNTRIEYNDNAINFVFIKGIYSHAERKMITACLFVNKMQTITELHGVLRLRFIKENAVIATVTVDFDQEFMGEIENNEALLVHFGIPVKGLLADKEFTFSDIQGDFSDVRVTSK